jgi:hypothetical protein
MPFSKSSDATRGDGAEHVLPSTVFETGIENRHPGAIVVIE